MKREALIAYLETLKHERDLDVTDLNHFKVVLLKSIDNYLYDKDDEILFLFKDNLKKLGGGFNELGQLEAVFPMYDAMQFATLRLWKEGKISYTEKNSFDVMQIKCLVLMDKKQKAINRANQVFHEFMTNKREIFQRVSNPKMQNLIYLLSSIRALYRYTKFLCLQLGHNQEASSFYYREKIIERFIRSHGAIDKTTDYELCNEHGALVPPIPTFFYSGNFLNEIKGRFKRLKFRLKVISDLLLNWLSYLFWGYGERPWNTVFAMIGIIFMFAGIYLHFNAFVTLGNVNFGDCLYYSFITFVTLGFGNIYPVDATYARILVGIEAFIGTILIALFIFTLGRKATR